MGLNYNSFLSFNLGIWPIKVHLDDSFFLLLTFSLFSTMQLEKEVKELTKQRHLAESRVEDLLHMVGDDQSSEQKVCTVSLMFRKLSQYLDVLLQLSNF